MFSAPPSRAARTILLTLLLIYGVAAGLRTVADFDLGWQMADASHPFSSIESLSYTAAGRPWIYPPLAGVVFRALFHLGGYTAISLLCCAALLFTLAVTAWRSSLGTLGLLLLVLPALAAQMIPRSGLFTVIIAAVFARILFGAGNRSEARRGLWLLPPLMVLWVNFHPGFIAGLALMAAYVAVRLLEPPHRLYRRELGWLLATAAATLANPWGINIYRVVAAQEHSTAQQSASVVELEPLYQSFSLQHLHLLAPSGVIWCLLGASAVAAVLLLWQKRYGLAALLGCATAACLLSARSQGVYIPLACLLAGPIFSQRMQGLGKHRRIFAGMALTAAIAYTAWGCFGFVTDRTAVHEDQITAFGVGASWWLPEGAAEFIEEKRLPAQLFSTFNLSSYLTWRLGPRYRDFADGRYLPFGDGLVAEQSRLATTPLDDPEWTAAANRWGIRTIIFPTSRLYGVELIPLREDCASRLWAPVYFDSRAIVFVRLPTSPDAPAATLPRVDCGRQQLIPKARSAAKQSRIREYQQLADAAVLYYLLGRTGEAKQALDRAQVIFGGDDSMLLLEGQIAAAEGRLPEAREAFRSALHLQASDAAWYQLGVVEAQEHRYQDAVRAFEQAERLAPVPSYTIEYALGRAQLLAGDREGAQRSIDKAMSLIRSGTSTAAAAARAALDDLASAACIQAGDTTGAIAAERRAISETPTSAARWEMLSSFYQARGQSVEARQAHDRAEAIRSSTTGQR